MAVCPFANQTYRYDTRFAGWYTGGPYKGILHTTEGTALPGYDAGSSAPHFTLLPNVRTKTVTVYQHYNTNRPSRALLNKAGGVQTNNDSAVQIELVGTCDPATHRKWANAGYPHIYWPEAPKWVLDELAKLMRWVEANHGIPRTATTRPWLPYPASYGSRSGQRMTGPEYDAFAGWLGHMHAAENDHGDPGNIDMPYLLAGPTVTKATVVKVATTVAALAAALGLSIPALLGANPQLPPVPTAPITAGATITVPATPPAVVATPRPAAPRPAPAPTKTSSRTTSYRVVTDPATARPVLRKGTAGAAVKAVQKAVGAPQDGFFGAGTETLVRAYQKAHGLTADGVVGSATWRVLAKPAPSTKSLAATYPVLRIGAESRHVRTVQKAVGVSVDGQFGPRTHRAVLTYQGKHRLTRDGVVGPATWAAIL